jgi:hypothetical protein
MKVRRLVELLYQTYDPEQEVIALWWGSEHFETKAGVWEKAVDIFDGQNPPSEFRDYISDIINDAEFALEMEEEQRLKSELAIDSFLDSEAEKKLER